MPQPRQMLLTGPVTGALLAAALLTTPAAAAASTATVPAAGTVPAAAGGGTRLFGVSCTSSVRCMTVGSRAVTGTRTGTLAQEWSGGRWRVLRTPDPKAARTSYLNEVSCRSASRCMAIGSSASKAHGTAALALAWNGSRWRLTRSAVPAGARSSELFDVSCRGSSGCIAVGDYTAASGVRRPFSERWNGVRWRRLATPDIKGARSGLLDGIFCGGSRCMAVGYARTTPSPFQAAGVAEQWNGHGWHLLKFSDPASATFTGLQDISCAPRSTCMAVGFTAAENGATRTLSELWRSGRWHRLKTAAGAPAGVILDGVSCPARSDCVAAGLRPTSSGGSAGSAGSAGGEALAAQAWNGSRWRTLKTPAPPLSTASFLNQVSCPAARRCLAVGSKGSGQHVSALAELWNGAGWKVLATPVP